MFKGSKASHYAEELHSARLRGHSAARRMQSDVNGSAGADFPELLRKFAKHNPEQTATADIVRMEYEMHLGIASFFESEGFCDASYSGDSPSHATFPPTMPPGLKTTEVVREHTETFGQKMQERELFIADATGCVVLRAYGLFMQGLDAEAAALIHGSRLLEANPLANNKSGSRTAQLEQHVAHAILGAAVAGLASERLAIQGEANERAERAQDALQAYAKANSFHEQLRGGAGTKAARTQPFVDEAERWLEVALYHNALLTMRVHGMEKGLECLRSYQAKESRWPPSFRMPQRNVLRNIYASALNNARTTEDPTPVSANEAKVRTTSTRRPNQAVRSTAPSSTWTNEYAAMRRTAQRVLEKSTSFPRSGESNENAESLADQLVLSWRLDGAQGGALADEVVDLLYGLSRVTFRSQTILRLLVQMLIAAEAFQESIFVLEKYMLLVQSTWQATGVPLAGQRKVCEGRYVDNLQQYIDTVLLGAHVELTYLGNAVASDTLCKTLLRFVGVLPKEADTNDLLPVCDTDDSTMARILRAAGRALAAQLQHATTTERSTLQRDAKAYLTRSLALDAQSSESQYLLACLLAELQDIQGATTCARAALELEPASLDAWHLVVLLLTAQRNVGGALQFAEEALTQAEVDEEADAQGAYTQLVSFDYPPTQRERAVSYLRLLITHNVLTELMEGTQAALAGQKELFAAFQSRVASVALDSQSQARLSSNDAAAPQTFARPTGTTALTASPAIARENYRARTERALLLSLWLLSAASFRRAGELEQARDAIAEAEQLDSLSPDIWVQLSFWCIDAQKSGAAVTCLYKALSCDPDHVPASVTLARLFLQPNAIHLHASHAESIATAATALDGGQVLTRLSLLDEGVGIDLESEALQSRSRLLGVHPGDGTEQPTSAQVAPAFAWRHDPSLPPLSIAEGLLRTATTQRGHSSPEAWHLLAQVSKHAKLSRDVQLRQLKEALRLENTRPIRPYHAALALP